MIIVHGYAQKESARKCPSGPLYVEARVSPRDSQCKPACLGKLLLPLAHTGRVVIELCSEKGLNLGQRRSVPLVENGPETSPRREATAALLGETSRPQAVHEERSYEDRSGRLESISSEGRSTSLGYA